LLKNKLEYFAFLSLAGLFRVLGVTRSRKFARMLGTFFFHVIPIRKETVIKNLTIAFPNKTEKEIIALTGECYKNFALTFSELLMQNNFTEEEYRTMLDFSEADETLKKYFESGKSFILLTGHFGNWELFSGISLFYGKRTYALAKEMRNSLVSGWVNKARERFGVKVVLLGSSIREVYKVLKENGIVITVADQRGPVEGVRVNFFNRQTAVYNGTAVLALRFNAPIILFFFVRQSNMNYKIVVKELDYSDLTGTDEEKIQIICQRYFSFLQSLIEQHPGQWFWMHKIWKY
jgi:Kdo2-lipid IVA lauroyltransferase/acyltransferase